MTTLRDLSRPAMVEGLDALDQRDYPKALKGFLAAQAVLDQRPMQVDSYEDRAVRAAVAYLTAKAMGEAKQGDPCPILKLAQSHVVTAAVLAATQPKIDHMREIGNEADDDIAAANVKFGCVKAPPPEKGTTPAKLAGHYYLSGVMETGSELLLKPDGTYEYYISYGSVDEFSRGTWQNSGDAVVLTHTKTPTGGPLFKLDSLEPWDVDAETYIQAARHEAQVKLVEKVCPFLADLDLSNVNFPPPMATASPTLPSAGDAPKVDDLLVYRRAEATEAQVRRTYENAARAAMMPDNRQPSRHETARGARHTWQSALDDLQNARNRADIAAPLPPAPIMPAICQLPEAPPMADILEKDWMRGFGVIVGDPVAGAKFSNVTVRFHFADGQTTVAKTQRRGFAWVEKRSGNPVAAISLSYQRGNDRADAPFERFPISNGAEGVQRVIIDSRQLVAPPFDELRLKISDGDLIGPRDRGRYTKRD